MQKRPQQTSFSQQLTIAVTYFTRFSLFPWFLIYLHSRIFHSWSKTVSAYGLLTTCFYFGSFSGRFLSVKSRIGSLLTFSFVSLTVCYFLLAFVNRYSLLCFLFTILGFSSAVLSGVSLTLDSKSPNIVFLKKPAENDIQNNLEYMLICFVFMSFFSGHLYDIRPFVRYPFFNFSMIMSAVSFFLCFYYAILSRFIHKNNQMKMKSIAQSKQHGSHGENEGFQSNDEKMVDINAKPDEDITYDGSVPANFYATCNNDLAKAQRMYGKYLNWRDKCRVDDIFDIPQQFFHEILQYYPHAIHGYSLDGCAVVYEILGKGRPRDLKNTGVSIDQLVWHFELRNELVFRRLLDPENLQQVIQQAIPGSINPSLGRQFDYSHPQVMNEPVRRLMTVLDVGGISIGSITSEVISFIKKSGEIIDNYYPEQVARLVIINAPRWFSSIWTVIARVLPESVQKKIDILYDSKGLDKYIHPSQRPRNYGGTDIDLGQAAGHVAFLDIYKAWEAKRTTQKESLQLNSGTTESDSHQDTQASANPSTLSKGLGLFKKWLQPGLSAPRGAYLGEKNMFKYNPVTETWDLESPAGPTNIDQVFDEYNSDDEDKKADRKPFPSAIESDSQLRRTVSTSSMRSNKPSRKADSIRHSGHVTASSTGDQLEEHGLILAIQAAHLASTFKRGQSSASSTGGDHQPLSFSMDGMDLEEATGGGSSHPRSFVSLNSNGPKFYSDGISAPVDPDGHLLNESGSSALIGGTSSINNSAGSTSSSQVRMKLSSNVFLTTSIIFFNSNFTFVCLMTLVPVWLICPTVYSGGLQLGFKDISLLFSFIGIICLVFYHQFINRLDHLLKSSPIRTLRIGCGMLLLSIFMLVSYFHLPRALDLEHIDHTLATKPSELLFDRAFDPNIFSIHSSLLNNPFVIPASSWHRLESNHPCNSLWNLIWLSSLLSLVVISAFVCKRSSSVLFHLVLGSSFQNPLSLRYFALSFIEIGGPLISCLIYSGIYSMRLKFPMDSRFFLFLAMCNTQMVYFLSLFLNVQFRGDYGVMSDDLDESIQAPSNIRNYTSTTALSKSRSYSNLHQRHQSASGPTKKPYISSFDSNSRYDYSQQESERRGFDESLLTWCLEMFDIPIADVQLLFSKAGFDYGSKSYNLKDDFKDL